MEPLTARADVHVNLAAVRSNTARLADIVAPAQVMAMVKADGYGHGLVEMARAALDGGAQWLGVALTGEALDLRGAGITAPILATVVLPFEDMAPCVLADVDLGVGCLQALDGAVAASRDVGRAARIHLKVDTGLSRGGATATDWPDLVDAAVKAQRDGLVDVVGIWSHLACADDPDHPSVRRQLAAFDDALAVVDGAGLQVTLRHLANTAAAVAVPATRFDMVRIGIGLAGLSPAPHRIDATALGLRPAMTLRARVALVKRITAGTGVSYGHRFVTEKDTTIALVPVGYGDGIPRTATNRGQVLLGGVRRRIAGTVCMDQFVVDVGDDPVAIGDEVVIFGPGDAGEPTADEWADVTDTISWEIVTRLGPRLPRTYRDG